MDAAANASRLEFKNLMETYYSECTFCQSRASECEKADEVKVLACLHVVCKPCLRKFNEQAIKMTTMPPSKQQTQYHNERRFTCSVCHWPMYRPYESTLENGFDGLPNQLPLYTELLALGDSPPRVIPNVSIRSDGQVKATSDPNNYETRKGPYVFESVMGDFGPNCSQGQMTRITGLAVDESYPDEPLVVVVESMSNYILTFTLAGRLEHARETGVRVVDVCIGECGTVIATVAEQSYALAKWDSGRRPHGGIRYENIFRNIFGHEQQIKSEPFGVTRDSRGRFVVTVLGKDRLVRWDERADGNHIYWMGDSGETGTFFNGPYYVAKMSNDLTVVTSTNSHKVKVIDEERERLVMEVGGLGCDNPDLCFPLGVCCDGEDNIFIADSGNFRVVMYNCLGEFVCVVVGDTWNYGKDVRPVNVAVMHDGKVVVAMQGRKYCKVHVYAPPREESDSPCCGLWLACLTSSCCNVPRAGYTPLD